MKVIVAGSGAVGLLAALQCQAAGFEVVCVGEQAPERTAAASGTAVVAPLAPMPLAGPGTARELGTLLAGKHPSGRLRLAALPQLAPWLAHVLTQARRSRTRANLHALASLLAHADGELTPWLRAAGAGELLRRRGSLVLAEGPRGRRSCTRLEALARTEGVAHERLDAAGVAQLEPALAAASGGIYFPEAFHSLDPAALLQRLGRLFRQRGGRLEADRLAELRPDPHGGVQARGERLGQLRADRAAIAAGAGSRRLAARLGDRLPVAAATGYHLDFAPGSAGLQRPVGLPDSGATLAPQADGVRAAGRWVWGGEFLGSGQGEIDRLVTRVQARLPELGEAGPGWAAERAVTADALPVIGRSGAGGDIVYAFGHGELGLALSGITGRLVADLLAYREPVLAPRPFRPQRFRWFG